jgi:hypothetical protein
MTDRSRFSIIDAIRHAEIFGPAFRDLSTWQSWLAFLSALFALPLTEAEAAIWCECTGRSTLPARPFTESWLVCGRRSGKTFIMALLGVHLACFRDYTQHLGPKTQTARWAGDSK